MIALGDHSRQESLEALLKTYVSEISQLFIHLLQDMVPLARQADQLQDGLISRIWLSNPVQSHCHGSESFN